MKSITAFFLILNLLLHFKSNAQENLNLNGSWQMIYSNNLSIAEQENNPILFVAFNKKIEFGNTLKHLSPYCNNPFLVTKNLINDSILNIAYDKLHGTTNSFAKEIHISFCNDLLLLQCKQSKDMFDYMHDGLVVYKLLETKNKDAFILPDSISKLLPTEIFKRYQKMKNIDDVAVLQYQFKGQMLYLFEPSMPCLQTATHYSRYFYDSNGQMTILKISKRIGSRGRVITYIFNPKNYQRILNDPEEIKFIKKVVPQ